MGNLVGKEIPHFRLYHLKDRKHIRKVQVVGLAHWEEAVSYHKKA